METPLYILREIWTETYNCSDEGLQVICETYADIKISLNKKILDEMADELNIGIEGYWSISKQNRLRSLYSNYDCMKESKFIVVDVSELFMD